MSEIDEQIERFGRLSDYARHHDPESGDAERFGDAAAALALLRDVNARLRHALKYAADAIDTGRSEPLFVARDHILNTLDDCAALTGEPSP